MTRFLISLILITTLNTNLFACKTPNELMDNYFRDFNSANSKKIEKNFSFPFMVIQNGKKLSIMNYLLFMILKLLRTLVGKSLLLIQ